MSGQGRKKVAETSPTARHPDTTTEASIRTAEEEQRRSGNRKLSVVQPSSSEARNKAFVGSLPESLLLVCRSAKKRRNSEICIRPRRGTYQHKTRTIVMVIHRISLHNVGRAAASASVMVLGNSFDVWYVIHSGNYTVIAAAVPVCPAASFRMERWMDGGTVSQPGGEQTNTTCLASSGWWEWTERHRRE